MLTNPTEMFSRSESGHINLHDCTDPILIRYRKRYNDALDRAKLLIKYATADHSASPFYLDSNGEYRTSSKDKDIILYVDRANAEVRREKAVVAALKYGWNLADGSDDFDEQDATQRFEKAEEKKKWDAICESW